MSVFESLLRHSRLLLGQGRTCRVLLGGMARGATAKLCVTYHGSEQTLPFLTGQLFESAPVVSAHQPPALQSTDLCIEERPPLAGLLHPPAHDLRMPAWISQQIDLGTNADAPFAFSRHVRREADRQIRRNGYRLDFSSEPSALREFYRDMYLPYVRSRFDAQAILADEVTFMRRAAGQTLARLHAGDNWMAGLLLTGDAHTLRFGWFGARCDPPPPGASEALDVLVIRWAQEQHLRQVVLGHSRPCLRDGVLRYKRRLGAQVHATRFPQSQIFLRIVRPSAWLAQCLNDAGFVRIRAGAAWVQRVDLTSGRTRVRLEAVQHERH